MQALVWCKCEKIAVYDLLTTDMVGGQAQAFTKRREK